MIYCEDEEDGFNVSPVGADGQILEHWCNQDELKYALNYWIEGRNLSIKSVLLNGSNKLNPRARVPKLPYCPNGSNRFPSTRSATLGSSFRANCKKWGAAR